MNDSGMDANSVDARSVDASTGSSTDTPTALNMDDLAAGLSGALDAISRGEPPQEQRFGFSHNGFYFTARAQRREDGEARLSLCGSIGILPYSAQSAFVRRCVLYLIDEKRRPALGRFLVQPNKRILFLAETGISPHMGRDAVIAGVCRILFDAKPHLDLMAECLAFVPLSRTRPQPRKLSAGETRPEETAAPPPGDEKKTSMKKVLSKVRAKDKTGLQVKKRKKPASKGRGKTKAKGKSGAAKKTKTATKMTAIKKTGAAKKAAPKKAKKKPKEKPL